MTKMPDKSSLSQEQLSELVSWLQIELDRLNKEIHLYNDKHDYYRAAQAEGTRDAYLRMLKKLSM